MATDLTSLSGPRTLRIRNGHALIGVRCSAVPRQHCVGLLAVTINGHHLHLYYAVARGKTGHLSLAIRTAVCAHLNGVNVPLTLYTYEVTGPARATTVDVTFLA
jgi:hypothetical protein